MPIFQMLYLAPFHCILYILWSACCIATCTQGTGKMLTIYSIGSLYRFIFSNLSNSVEPLAFLCSKWQMPNLNIMSNTSVSCLCNVSIQITYRTLSHTETVIYVCTNHTGSTCHYVYRYVCISRIIRMYVYLYMQNHLEITNICICGKWHFIICTRIICTGVRLCTLALGSCFMIAFRITICLQQQQILLTPFSSPTTTTRWLFNLLLLLGLHSIFSVQCGWALLQSPLLNSNTLRLWKLFTTAVNNYDCRCPGQVLGS